MAAGRSARVPRRVALAVLLALATVVVLQALPARAADDPGGLSSRIGATCSADLAQLDRQAESNHGAIARRMRARTAAGLRLGRLHVRQTATRRSLHTADTRVHAALATFRRFTAAHPEKALAPADYTAYLRLRATYEASLAKANALIRESNALVRAYNASVVTVNASSGALARLATADNRANVAAQSREDACLAPIADWASATRALDARLAVAARAAGTRAPTVVCDSPAGSASARGGANGAFERAGYVIEGQTTIHLDPRTCLALERVVDDPGELGCVTSPDDALRRCPPSVEEDAHAIVTLAHEEQHVDGITNEAQAQCYALQRAGQAALELGLHTGAARTVSAFTRATISQPAAYSSPQCRRGGSLDVTPPGDVWFAS